MPGVQNQCPTHPGLGFIPEGLPILWEFLCLGRNLQPQICSLHLLRQLRRLLRELHALLCGWCGLWQAKALVNHRQCLYRRWQDTQKASMAQQTTLLDVMGHWGFQRTSRTSISTSFSHLPHTKMEFGFQSGNLDQPPSPLQSSWLLGYLSFQSLTFKNTKPNVWNKAVS